MGKYQFNFGCWSVALLTLWTASVWGQGLEADAGYSFVMSPRAVAEVAALDAKRLGEDEAFLEVLSRVLKDPAWTPIERVDAFYLMQRKIGLGFTGWVSLPPHWGYHHVFWERVRVFEAYRDVLAGLEIDGELYVEVARSSYRDHPVRMGHALLLTALLDRDSTQKVLDILTNPKRLVSSPVPPIAMHYLALSAAVSGERPRVEALGTLLAEVPLEESREDLILAMGYRKTSQEVLTMLETHITRTAQTGFDLSTGAALIVMHRQLDADAYEVAWGMALAASNDEVWWAGVQQYRKGPAPRGGMGEPSTSPLGESVWLFKKWDGYSVAIEDERTVVRWGEAFFDTQMH